MKRIPCAEFSPIHLSSLWSHAWRKLLWGELERDAVIPLSKCLWSYTPLTVCECLIQSGGTCGTLADTWCSLLSGPIRCRTNPISPTHVFFPSLFADSYLPWPSPENGNMINDRAHVYHSAPVDTDVTAAHTFFTTDTKSTWILDTQTWFITASDQTGGKKITIPFIFDDCSEMSAHSTVGSNEKHNNQPYTITETIAETKALLFLFWEPNMTLVTMAITQHQFNIEMNTFQKIFQPLPRRRNNEGITSELFLKCIWIS